MGVIIKYQLEFPEVGLTVSNDLFSGEFILDAAIKATMNRRMEGGAFAITLHDLPLEKVKEIKEKAASFATVIINLGYFDGSFANVMEGVIEKLSSQVQDDKLMTTITGLEICTYALTKSCPPVLLRQDMDIVAAVKKVVASNQIESAQINATPQIQNITTPPTTSPLDRDRAYSGEKLVKILDDLAELAHAEFFIVDKTVWMGKPIKNDESYIPPKFDRNVNLADFSPIAKEITEECQRYVLRPLPATRAEAFDFTITGDPQLRPGQIVEIDVEEFNKDEFRVHSVTHNFTTSGGYTCQGKAIKTCSDDNCRRRELVLVRPSAEGVVGGLTETAETAQRTRPWIEIGKIKSYTPGESTEAERHLSTLYFRQRFERTETQPSINVEVDTNEEQLFSNKPIVSPFAWHKCGLAVPVYPGMKAVLNHNLKLQDDALITGFIWSEQPAIEPPKNKEGDWWLCLPIDFDTSQPPTDSTKAVNDLIANNGKRVIEVKGLKITIGKDRLANVGERPSEGDDDEFLIEHKSGTKFTIDSGGTLTIEATNISITGDVTIEGNVDII